MKGLVIYDNIGYERNKWFIEKLIESCYKRGITLELHIYKSLHKIPLQQVNFALVRTINPSINSYLEKKGIKCINNYETSLIANDKYKTYKLCKQLAIPVMPTYLSDENVLQYPFVCKSVDGHGGSEVFMVSNHSEMAEADKILGKNGKKYIVQQPCSLLGVDIRVYVMQGKILAMAKRSSKADFRSNFSLGGSCEIVDIASEVMPYITKIYNHLKCDYVGIDFIYDEDKLVLNEIEDIVGSRMLYKLTDICVHEKIAQMISDIMNNK